MKESIKKRIEAVRRGEVPEGYRRTRAGLMPLEWQGDLSAKDVFCNYTNKKHNGAYEVLSATQDRGIIPRSEVDIDIKYAEENIGSYKKVDSGDFVISLRSFQGGIEYSEYEGLVSPAYTVLKAAKPISDNYYRAYFKTPDFISRLNGAVYGIRDGKQIGFEDFGELSIHYPPVAEQQKIAEILTTCDRLIELKQQLLEEKRRQKQWLMQKLLDPNSGVQPRGCSGKWKQWRLQDLGVFSKGSGISNEDCSSGACPCIKYGDIYVSYDEFFVDAISHTEAEIFDKAPIVHKGTLLFTGSGEDPKEIGKCTAYLGDEPIAVGGDIIVMKPNEAVVNPLFLAYALNSYSAIKQKAYLGQGYSVVHIYGEDIKRISVDIPAEIEMQEKIAEIIMTSNRKIHLIENEIASWKQKKKALMQFLLTGLVRVNT